MDDLMKDRIEQLIDYVMKWSLWQFNSRTWDREKQNEGIISRATQILCDEPVERSTPADRLFWVEAMVLAKDFKETYAWLNTMDKKDIKLLMQGFKERMDYLTITGSLNKELTNPIY